MFSIHTAATVAVMELSVNTVLRDGGGGGLMVKMALSYRWISLGLFSDFSKVALLLWFRGSEVLVQWMRWLDW